MGKGRRGVRKKRAWTKGKDKRREKQRLDKWSKGDEANLNDYIGCPPK